MPNKYRRFRILVVLSVCVHISLTVTLTTHLFEWGYYIHVMDEIDASDWRTDEQE